MYLWRAVDDEGEILDMLVQRACDEAMANCDACRMSDDTQRLRHD